MTCCPLSSAPPSTAGHIQNMVIGAVCCSSLFLVYEKILGSSSSPSHTLNKRLLHGSLFSPHFPWCAWKEVIPFPSLEAFLPSSVRTPTLDERVCPLCPLFFPVKDEEIYLSPFFLFFRCLSPLTASGRSPCSSSLPARLWKPPPLSH